MDKLLRPAKLEVDPHAPEAELIFNHWLQTFQRFRQTARNAQPEANRDGFDLFGLLVDYLAPNVFPLVEETKDYYTAITTFKTAFVKTKNVVFARHILAAQAKKQKESLQISASTFVHFCKHFSKFLQAIPVVSER